MLRRLPGSGSASTARSSSSRFTASPMASGVWSRLRLFRCPSDASSAASNAWQTCAGRIVGPTYALQKENFVSDFIDHCDVEAVTGSVGAFVTMLHRRDIEIHAGEIVEYHPGGRTGLEGGESFDIAETALAGFNHACVAALLRHQRNQLFMVGHAAVSAHQTVALPLAGAAAAAEITATIDAAHFGDGRPATAYGAITFNPALRQRARPAAIAGV